MFATAECPHHRFVDVSYVDDCAFPIFSNSLNLCDKIARTLGIVQDAFTSFGMSVIGDRPAVFAVYAASRSSSRDFSMHVVLPQLSQLESRHDGVTYAATQHSP